MKKLTDKEIKILVLRDNKINTWSIHCLEYPIFAQSKDPEKLVQELNFMANAYFREEVFAGYTPFEKERSASELFFKLWNDGEDVTTDAFGNFDECIIAGPVRFNFYKAEE